MTWLYLPDVPKTRWDVKDYIMLKDMGETEKILCAIDIKTVPVSMKKRKGKIFSFHFTQLMSIVTKLLNGLSCFLFLFHNSSPWISWSIFYHYPTLVLPQLSTFIKSTTISNTLWFLFNKINNNNCYNVIYHVIWWCWWWWRYLFLWWRCFSSLHI